MGELHESAVAWMDKYGGEFSVIPWTPPLELHVVKTHSDLKQSTSYAAFPMVNGRAFNIRLDWEVADEAMNDIPSDESLEEHLKNLMVTRLLEDVFEAAEEALHDW